LIWLVVASLCLRAFPGDAQEIVGMNVTPHRQSSAMRWRRPPSSELAARVELFLLNQGESELTLERSRPVHLDGQLPSELVSDGELAWFDTPNSWLVDRVALPVGALTVFSFNGKADSWAVGTDHWLQFGDSETTTFPFSIDPPLTWLSAVAFLNERPGHEAEADNAIEPNHIVVHLVNAGKTPLQIEGMRLWLPKEGQSHHVLYPSKLYAQLHRFPDSGMVDQGSRGGFYAEVGDLPLRYAAVEVITRRSGSEQSVWAYLRIKREVFDISGGWVASDIGGRNALTLEPYLKTLKRMHLNTGQIEEVGGYTDDPDLYARYPLKRFNRMQDLDRYDRDEMLPQIHAIEFLGEPQYGGGRPIRPQEVWEALAPYQSSRLPTSVTLSEERTWRYYAGLSDYPHYDAYRVIAPAADAWGSYDRWGGERIRWGAPLETIGDMTRSLRELSRPRSIAYWSQGAHDGWGGRFSPRRGSPTPDELRAQAWQALANRVTSLYWFNLSLKSLVKYRDLIEPITRVNREIRIVEPILLWGDAFEYHRLEKDGRPDWDLNSIACPDSMLLVAHNLDYRADPDVREFVFSPRDATLRFKMASWLVSSGSGEQLDLFRVDAEGTHDVSHTFTDGAVEVRDQIKVVGIYVLTANRSLRAAVERKNASLLRQEREVEFDPANRNEDYQTLQFLLSD
jgi:hypothetical protein